MMNGIFTRSAPLLKPPAVYMSNAISIVEYRKTAKAANRQKLHNFKTAKPQSKTVKSNFWQNHQN